MTTADDPDRTTFADVDWEREAADRTAVSTTAALQLGAYVLLLAGALYDLLAASDGSPPWAAMDAVDWLLATTLAVAFFDAVLPLARNRRLARYYWRRFRRNRVAVVALWFVVVASAVGLVGPLVVEPPRIELFDAYRPPVGVTAAPQGEPVTGTWEYPLGTDGQGRDILALVVYGTRVSLEVGLVSAFIAVTVGTVVGTTAAHFGGMVDEVLMRYVDVQSVFPTFMLLLLVVYLYGGSLILLIALFGFFSWEHTARLIRSEALQRTEESYVRAAEAAGASRAWIVRRHVIPNVSSTAITAATLTVPIFVLQEASLSFLGFTDDSIHSWGSVIADGRNDLSRAPWITTIPGLVLFAYVLAINYVGDALRDATDPRGETR